MGAFFNNLHIRKNETADSPSIWGPAPQNTKILAFLPPYRVFHPAYKKKVSLQIKHPFLECST